MGAVGCILLAAGLGGCATPGAGQVSASKDAPFQHDYLIGPGDNLQISVWRYPDVSVTAPVRPDGKITTPLVEDLQASGKTSTELAREIEKSLAKFIKDPVVTVTVTGFSGPYGEQIKIIGQAVKPQALPYKNGMSLMDVLIAVGGITPYASGNQARVMRQADGKMVKLPVRLSDLLKDGDLSANMPMRPGDVLVIPESFF
ncbi:XrtA/PEP-CTERM system exopolysaccharide export protein [Noviherbaspirillum galbum]|uniref:Sugar ABC transporter substrate-binding protein n=1 Tax=Noviherbaspirillum galbum TaxID=2709383 RepID=A0A6B3STR5_9BURK|nr:XrtA/PEP-CTERM system exopolysaccharide export protein [Noviherbaspirillum galbum]NEX64127.1 sugar ABC transporter substrate-binding protein [Noviherbaspirillum galbum]